MRRASVFIPAFLALAAAFTLAVPQWIHGQAGERERTIYVSAVDEQQEPVEDLELGDFIVTEDGRQREVLRISRAVESIDIALLVDNSAAAAQAIVPLREGLRRFVTTMAGDSQIAIVALAGRPTILVDYTSDPKRLEDGIGRIFAESASSMTLLDAIVEVSAGLANRDTPRAVIVPVITDGAEFSNRYFRGVVEALTRAGAGLHAITLGRFPVTTEAERDRSLVLDLGAEATGGQRVALLADSAVPQALQRLARELSSQYKVVYGRPESFLPPEEITVSARRPGVIMRSTPARARSGT